MCVCEEVSLQFCQSCHLKAELPSAAGNTDINGDMRAKTQRRGQAGETAAVQSSGLATDSFRKIQTLWNEELRIKL